MIEVIRLKFSKEITFCWFCSINRPSAKAACDDFVTCPAALATVNIKKSLSALKYQLNWTHLERFINSKVSTNPKWLRFTVLFIYLFI